MSNAWSFFRLQLGEFYWQCNQVSSFLLPRAPNHLKLWRCCSGNHPPDMWAELREAEQLICSGRKAICRMPLSLNPHGYSYPVSPWLPKRTSHFSVGCWSPFKPELQLWPVSFFLMLCCSPSFRRWVVSVTCADLTPVRAQSHRLTYTESWQLHHYHPFILFSCLSSPADAFSLLLCLLLTAREGKPLLNYFPSPRFPTPQIVSPPSTASSRKSICARGGTL